MFKYNYFQIGTINSSQELNKLISEKIETLYNIGAESVLTKITERENLGTVQIADDFDLPHIEYDGQKQGIILASYQMHHYSASSLFLILNAKHPDKDLEKFLGKVLNDVGLDKLRNCRSNNDLQKIIKEG